MKLSFKIISALFIINLFSAVYPQIRSVETFAEYTAALSKTNGVTKADAPGGGIHILFGISGKFSLGLLTGYKLYSVSQENQLPGWNWRFWNERYKNKVESDLRADPNLGVTITSVQKMDLIPLALTLTYEINLLEQVSLYTTAGGGFNFFTRRMYVLEEWSKKFPQQDYTFNYSYRNFAPDKKGNPLFVMGSVDFIYNLLEYARLQAGIRYSYIIPAKGKMGYDSFIYNDEISFKIGLTFAY